MGSKTNRVSYQLLVEGELENDTAGGRQKEKEREKDDSGQLGCREKVRFRDGGEGLTAPSRMDPRPLLFVTAAAVIMSSCMC